MRKSFKVIISAIVLTLSITGTAFAGQWKQNTTGWWYQRDDGSNPSNKWEQISDKWYYFTPAGYINTNWIKVSDKWYYCEPSGEMRTTALQTDVMLFQFNSDGSCSNFYENSTPSVQAGWSPYSAGSVDTLQRAILDGKVVHYEGQYWLKPDYVSMAKNETIAYFNDIAPAQQTNRYSMADATFKTEDTASSDKWDDDWDSDDWDSDGLY